MDILENLEYGINVYQKHEINLGIEYGVNIFKKTWNGSFVFRIKGT